MTLLCIGFMLLLSGGNFYDREASRPQPLWRIDCSIFPMFALPVELDFDNYMPLYDQHVAISATDVKAGSADVWRY